MELRRLRYLVKVVDAGGFRRASEMLNVAQPALTRQVQALEAEFGGPTRLSISVEFRSQSAS